MSSYPTKKILVLLTGGTIAGNVAENNVNDKLSVKSDSFQSILDNSVEIIERSWGITVQSTVTELFNLDSSNIVPSNWMALIEKIYEQYDLYEAFIIVHGTNTMGYTTAALSFALENINKPVIVTGSQVPLGYLGSDATTNLVNSLRLCAWGYHPIKGVLAVFGSKIITGARVKKGTDFDYDPFISFSVGAIGQIGRFIRINESALEKHTSYLSKASPLAIQKKGLSIKKEFNTSVIASLTEFPGMRADLFQTLVEHNGIRGFIFRAFGAGDASIHLLDSFEYLKQKQIPIVVTSQAPSGVASFQVNETGKLLRERDLAIPAYDMNIESMTVKLAWLIGQNFSYEQIKTKMLVDMHGEISIDNELL